MRKRCELVDCGNFWVVRFEDGNLMIESNVFGAFEVVEFYKEDYGYDLKLAEYLEKNYRVEVWQTLEETPEFDIS